MRSNLKQSMREVLIIWGTKGQTIISNRRGPNHKPIAPEGRKTKPRKQPKQNHRCTKCKITKPSTEFSYTRTKIFQRSSVCKPCKAEEWREQYAKPKKEKPEYKICPNCKELKHLTQYYNKTNWCKKCHPIRYQHDEARLINQIYQQLLRLDK